jgi:peroxiredoxin
VVTDTDGNRLAVDDLRGKVVLVNFFATWCGPCRLELPHVEQLWQDHRDEGLAVIVIGREESEQSVAAFRSEQGYTFPMAPDPERSVYSQFATELIPRTYLISPAGKICYAASGFDEESLSQLRSEVDRQLQTLR